MSLQNDDKEVIRPYLFGVDDDGDRTCLVPSPKFNDVTTASSPAVVIQREGYVQIHDLVGEQLLGRAAPYSNPDIPLNAPFVSRRHGLFAAEGTHIRYTALKSTNGTYFQGRRLADGETIDLEDGDVLKIYAGANMYADITIECAFSTASRKNWEDVITSQRDDLTGLMNRKMFSHWFANQRVLNQEESIFVFLLDVDRFKQINDQYGHQNGDLALTTLTKVLEAELKPYGKLARWGGDEFCGVLFADKDTTLECFAAVLDSLSRTKIDDLFTVSISVGLVRLNENENESLEDLLVKADKALYEAKQNGRNQIVLKD